MSSFCYSILTNRFVYYIVADPHKSTSKNGGNDIYLYYYSSKYNRRLNENKIIEQMGKFVDKYVFGKYLSELKLKIQNLKKHDERVKTLVKLFEAGLIDLDYYNHITIESKKKVRFGEKQINELFGRFNRWMVMTQDEKSKFSGKNIQRIEIDVINGHVVNVLFK